MPTCPTCHVAAITAAQSATVVRDLGIVGAISLTAAPILAIRRERTKLIADREPAVRPCKSMNGRRRAVREPGLQGSQARLAPSDDNRDIGGPE